MKIHREDIRFGIEFEFTGIPRMKVVEILARYFGHDTDDLEDFEFRVRDELRRKWDVERDSTIKPIVPKDADFRDEEFKVELVTPILTLKDIDKVKQIIKEISEEGGKVNGSCGLHFHVDAKVHTPASLKRMVKQFYKYQYMMASMLRVRKSRMRYCRPLGYDFIKRLQGNGKSLEDIGRIFKSYRRVKYGNSGESHKYANLNLLNIDPLDETITPFTFEFRMANGTLNPEKVEALAYLFLGMTEKSVNFRRKRFSMKQKFNKSAYNAPSFEKGKSKSGVEVLYRSKKTPLRFLKPFSMLEIEKREKSRYKNRDYTKDEVIKFLKSMGVPQRCF